MEQTDLTRRVSAALLSYRYPVAADSPAYGVRAALSRAVNTQGLPVQGKPAEYFGPAVRQKLPDPPVLQVARPLHYNYQLRRHSTWPCRYGSAVYMCLRNAVCRRRKGLKSPTSRRHGKGAVHGSSVQRSRPPPPPAPRVGG